MPDLLLLRDEKNLQTLRQRRPCLAIEKSESILITNTLHDLRNSWTMPSKNQTGRIGLVRQIKIYPYLNHRPLLCLAGLKSPRNNVLSMASESETGVNQGAGQTPEERPSGVAHVTPLTSETAWTEFSNSNCKTYI